jgi:hypothetical protein
VERGHTLCDLFLQTDAADLNGLDCNDEAPMFHAARAGALRALFVLLDQGCSIEIVNCKQLTVFQVCLRDFRDCAIELLMSGALMDEELVVELVDRQVDLDLELQADDDSSQPEQVFPLSF